MEKPFCDTLTDGAGIRLFLRLTPNASRNAIAGVASDGNGQQHIKATVTAVPENGKANTALIKLLAKTAKWPKSSVEIVAGHTEISGDPDALIAQLHELTGGQDI